MKAFQKSANRVGDSSSDKNMVHHLVRIVPAPFYATYYVNDGWYLPGDEVLETARVQKAQENSSEFFPMETPANASEFKFCKIFIVKALPKNEKGEELFLHYGSGYHFL